MKINDLGIIGPSEISTNNAAMSKEEIRKFSQMLYNKVATSREAPIASIKWFISQGADVNFVSESGKTPLQAALEQKHHNIAESLISNGANPQPSYDFYGKKLCDLISGSAPLDNIKYIIDEKKANINVVNSSGKTPMRLALEKERTEVLSLLIKKEPELGQVFLDQELCEGILKGNLIDDLAKLINLGANVNFASEGKLSPLYLSLKQGNILLAKLLVKLGAKQDEQTKNILLEMAQNEYLSSDEINYNPEPLKKEKLIMLYGWKYLTRSKASTLESETLKCNLYTQQLFEKYFDVFAAHSMNSITDLSEVIKQIKEGFLTGNEEHINIIIRAHGVKASSGADYKVALWNWHGGHIEFKKLLEQLNKELGDNGAKKLKILTIACFGANIHASDVALAEGSFLISLSDKDKTLYSVMDHYHRHMNAYLDSIHLLEGNFKLEYLLKAYCFSQRFAQNTPVISVFTNKGRVTLGLDQYLKTNLSKVSISPTVKQFLSIEKIDQGHLLNLLEKAKTTDINDFRALPLKEHLCIPEKTEGTMLDIAKHYYDKLIKNMNDYFVPGALEGFIPAAVDDSIYRSFFKQGSQGKVIEPYIFEHSFLLLHSTMPLLLAATASCEDLNDPTCNATPNHSLLMLVSADMLVNELNNGCFVEGINIVGENISSSL